MEDNLKEKICSLFPPGSNIVHAEGEPENFNCHIKLCISKREEFAEWLDHHSLLSGVKYVMMKCNREKGYLYNAIYSCRQNKRKPKSSDQQQNNCKSTLRVMIRRVSPTSNRAKTSLLRPTTVSLSYSHNHQIFAEDEARPNFLDDCDFNESLSKLFPHNTTISFAVRYGTDKDFICHLKVDVQSKEDFNKWLDEHSLLSYVTYRVKKTEAKDKSLYNAYYRCHHNTLPRKDSKPHRKHTNCNATLHVVIREKPECSGMYTAKITLNHIHNHDIMANTALVHRDPSAETREKFLSLFRNGVGPAQAYHIHHADLKELYDKDYNLIMFDRHICPDRQWVYRLYYSLYDEKHRSSQFQATVDSLNVQIFNLNSGGETCAEMQVTDDKEIVIAICSPFMRRVHLLKSAGDVAFVSSTGNSDKFNFKVLVLMTDSFVGGLPLAVLLMTSEKESTVSAGLGLLLKILPAEAFSGRGNLGPALFVTDDSSVQRSCFKKHFPSSKYVSCPFHMIQAAWKWMTNKRNGVQAADQSSLFDLLTNLIASTNQKEFQNRYKDCLSHEISQRYPSFLRYTEEFGRNNKERWEDYCKINAEHQENYQNSLLETAVHVLRDCAFKRIKSYNLLQSFEFFTVGYSNYYIQKILDTVGESSEQYPQSEFMIKFSTDDLEVDKVSDGLFQVVDSNSKTEYNVRGDFSLCDCFAGVSCNPCKHQDAVWKSLEEELGLKYLDSKMQQDLVHIATGQVVSEETGEWYDSLTYDIPQEGVVLILTNDDIEVVEPGTAVEAVEEPLDEDNFWTEMNRFSDKLLPLFRGNPQVMMEAWRRFSEKIYDISTETELLAFFDSCRK